MGEVIEGFFPGEHGSNGGSGPEDPMLEQRVAQLEIDMKSVKEALRRIESSLTALTKDAGDIRAKLAFIEGRLQGMPSTWQLLTIILTTWSVGTALIFAILKFAQP